MIPIFNLKRSNMQQNTVFLIRSVFRESQYLVGFVLRRDLQLAIANARTHCDTLPGNTLVVFTQHLPMVGSGPPPLKLRKIVDLAPITITDQVMIYTIFRQSARY